MNLKEFKSEFKSWESEVFSILRSYDFHILVKTPYGYLFNPDYREAYPVRMKTTVVLKEDGDFIIWFDNKLDVGIECITGNIFTEDKIEFLVDLEKSVARKEKEKQRLIMQRVELSELEKYDKETLMLAVERADEVKLREEKEAEQEAQREFKPRDMNYNLASTLAWSQRNKEEKNE